MRRSTPKQFEILKDFVCDEIKDLKATAFTGKLEQSPFSETALERVRKKIAVVLGRPSLKGTVFDRILGPKNGPEDFAVEPSFLCRVCDTWQARRCLQSS